MLEYIEYLYNEDKSYGSVNQFRSWLAHIESRNKGCQLISNDKRIILLLKGFQNTRIKEGKVIRTKPIRLIAVLKIINSPLLLKDAKHMVAIAYSFLLRHSEVVDILTHRSSITHEKKGWILHLYCSKTDQLQKGLSVFFPEELIPQELLGFVANVADDSVLWSIPSHQFLNNAIKSIMEDPTYRFHGFRHGRTMDLLADGTPEVAIKQYGRWKSDVGFKNYVHK